MLMKLIMFFLTGMFLKKARTYFSSLNYLVTTLAVFFFFFFFKYFLSSQT
jgi:hypothetical protein